MPTCKVCANHFPNRIKINDKFHVLNSRKRCLKCSPFGMHNTSPVYRHLEPRQNTGAVLVCQICGKQYEYKNGYGSQKCASCMVNIRRYKIKKDAIEYKGGCCQKCGYNKSARALTFHQIDPSTKKFIIGGSHCRSWQIIQNELDKCILLCMNCHAEEEDELLKSHPGYVEKLNYKWKPQEKKELIVKTCPICNNIFKTMRTKTKYCSNKCSTFSYRKVMRPAKEELQELLWSIPTSCVAKQFNISDNAVAKWAKSYGLSKPPRGYWSKKKFGKI